MEYAQKEMKIKIEILTVINRMRILIKYEKDMICFLRLTENSFLAEKRIVTNQIAPFFYFGRNTDAAQRYRV